jgi:adenine-specific DNA-methyltransferase
MYNVGPYTIAPIKVVWRRMDRRINAAVVEEVDDPWLGRRPVIPQETCVLVACGSADEAHYICAVLNSAIVNERILACSVRGGKGFGTPGMLDFVPLCRFRPDDPRHVELAALSRMAHADAVERIEPRIDRLAAELLAGPMAFDPPPV